MGLIPGLERSPGKGNGNPFQYSCLENPMNRGGGYSPWGCKELAMTEHTQAHMPTKHSMYWVFITCELPHIIGSIYPYFADFK